MTNGLEKSGEEPTGMTAADLAARKFLDEQAKLTQSGANAQIEATNGLLPEGKAATESIPETQSKTTSRQIAYGETLSGIASEALGPEASTRDIYNYVRQIARYNNIADANKVSADSWLEMPQYVDPRAKPSTDTPPEAQNQNRTGQAEPTPEASPAKLVPTSEPDAKDQLDPAAWPAQPKQILPSVVPAAQETAKVEPEQSAIPTAQETAKLQPEPTVAPAVQGTAKLQPEPTAAPSAQETAKLQPEPTVAPAVQETAKVLVEPAGQEKAKTQTEPVAKAVQQATQASPEVVPAVEKKLPDSEVPPAPRSNAGTKNEIVPTALTDPKRIIVEQPGSKLYKTMRVGSLAVDGAVEHVKAHPYLVAGEAGGGALVGGVLIAKGPTWLKAGAAIGGIGYLGYNLYQKSKEVLPALGTIYSEKADKNELEKAEKIVKHDLGVGLVDGTTMVVGGIGAKVVAGKIASKAGAVVVGKEGVEEGTAKALQSAPKGQETPPNTHSSSAGSDKTGDKTGGISNSGGDKTGDKTGSVSNSGGDKTGDKTGGVTNSGGDKTGDKTGGVTNSGGDKTGDKTGPAKSNNPPSDNNANSPPSDKSKTRDRSRVNDSVFPAAKPVKSASAEWTGNKYKNGDGSFRQEDSHWISQDGRVALVADGMGGEGGGDTASLITTNIMKARMPLLAENASQKEAETWLKESIEAAAERIKLAQQEGAYTAPDGTVHATTKTMGSTIVATVKHEGKMLVAWAGDSRAYRLKGGKLEQLTEDHSWDNQARRLGVSEADIAAADNGHLITSALGNTLKIGQVAVEIEPGDKFLLASDGLERLSTQQIEAVFAGTSTPEETSRGLIEAVKQAWHSTRLIHKTQDNTSVVVLEPVMPKPLPNVKPPVKKANIAALKQAQPYAISAGWVNGLEDSNSKKSMLSN